MRAIRGANTLLLVLIAATPIPLRAQLSGRSVELFGTVAAVGGVAPISIDGSSHAGLYGGLRLDGGVQGGRVGVGAGFRVWEFAPTRTYGGHGVSGFISSEWRLGASHRNMLRVAAGAGFDEVDPGRGPYRENTGTSGLEWALGVAHEAVAPSGAEVLLSADIVMPSTNTDVNGRRLPVLELGFGYRRCRYQVIE